jgi:hypothetical protein
VVGTVNLVPNPGIHEDASGWVSSWGDTVALSNIRSVVGDYSVRISNANSDAGLGVWHEVTGLTPGETYTLSASLYVPSGQDSSLVGQIACWNGGTIGVYTSHATHTTLTDQWVRLNVSNVCPANGGILIGIFDQIATDSSLHFFFDAVQLELGDSPTPYCDGNQPHCRWLGDVNDSPSTRDSFTGTTIDLIGQADGTTSGYMLKEWAPQIAEYKGGGIWSESPFSDGRRLKHKQFSNVIETFKLVAKSASPNTLARQQRDMRRLLEDASNYWTIGFNERPVWLEARAACETDTRYAYVHTGAIPADSPHFAQPFLQPRSRLMNDLSLIVERGHWMDAKPGESSSVALCSTQMIGFEQYALDFVELADSVNCGSHSSVDDLSNAAFTAEAMVYIRGGAADREYIFEKVVSDTAGWFLGTFSAGIEALVHANIGTNAQSITTQSVADGWHHVAMVWVSPLISLYIDGIEVTYSERIARSGHIDTDAAGDLRIGSGDTAFNGLIGWARISSAAIYTSNFTPPTLCDPPSSASVAMWRLSEGTGSLIEDETGNNDGTISGAEWKSLEFPSVCVGSAVSAVDGDGVCVCDGDLPFAVVANHSKLANLTNIHIRPTGPNLINRTTSYTLHSGLSSTYFAISSSEWGDSPFFGLVFNLVQPNSGYEFVWEIYTGAWSPISTISGDDQLDKHGVNVVTFMSPGGWRASSAIAGVASSLWVRMRVTVAGTEGAIQDGNYRIYTPSTPYFDISDVSNTGIQNLERVRLMDYGRDSGSGFFHNLGGAYLAVRSLSRGPDFNAYVNFSDRQIPDGITLQRTGMTSALYYVNRLPAATGRAIRFTPSGAGDAAGIVIGFDRQLFRQYTGNYRVILRLSEDYAIDFVYTLIVGTYGIRKTVGALGDSVDGVFADFGEIYINGDDFNSYLTIMIVSPSGIGNVDLTDLVLLPSDEFIVYSRLPDNTQLGWNSTMTFDGIDPKSTAISYMTKFGTNRRQAMTHTGAREISISGLGSEKRVWVMMHPIWLTQNDWLGRSAITAGVTADRVGRHFSLMGDD